MVETPESGAKIDSDQALAFVSGRALRLADGNPSSWLQAFEVLIVIDTSASTRAPSGADVDGDGRLGRMPFAQWLPFLPRFISLESDDLGDSILAAEVAAARTLLSQLEPDTSRVGIVAFAGDDYSEEPDAFTVVPLTDDYAQVEDALDRLLEMGSAGMTNIPNAIDVAVAELSTFSRRSSDPEYRSRRVVLFMTDGQPTLPVPNRPSENARRALEAAERAALETVRLHAFGISPESTEQPEVLEALAHLTGGTYTAVRHPRDLVATFSDIRLAEIAEIEIVNRTNHVPAEFTHLAADGSFSGVVELTEGVNQVDVRALSSDGLEAMQTIDVHLLSGAGRQRLTSRLLERRRRLLENRLDELGEEFRDALAAQMERERAERRREKQLEVELEEDESGAIQLPAEME